MIELIGAGGMARVFRAHHAQLDRDVAIKVLSAHHAAEPTFLARFTQEAKTVARLRHSHIVGVYDIGDLDGAPYIIMEYMSGGSLATRVTGAMLPSAVAPIISDVAAGLDYAHDQGVLHRDVKPGNVFFNTQGDAVVGDFGLAKIVEAAKMLTTAGTTLGTPEFMSPEQAMGKALDRRTDVYSLGAVAYQLLTGVLPYGGDTPLAIMLAHVQQPLPAPRQHNQSIPVGVEDVLLKALAKSPDDRFATAGEFAAALAAASAAALRDPPSSWGSATISTLPSATPAAVAPKTVGSPPVTPAIGTAEVVGKPKALFAPFGRRGTAALVGGAAVAILAIGVALSMMDRGGSAGGTGPGAQNSQGASGPGGVGAVRTTTMAAGTTNPATLLPAAVQATPMPAATSVEPTATIVEPTATATPEPTTEPTEVPPTPSPRPPTPVPTRAPPPPTATVPPEPPAQPVGTSPAVPMGSEPTPAEPRPAPARPTARPDSPAAPTGVPVAPMGS